MSDAGGRGPQPRRAPQFLEREGYRRRRIIDALRMLPVVGLFLWALPLLWPTEAGSAPTTSATITYVFLVWVGLVLAALLLSLRLRRSEPGRTPGPRAR